MFRYEWLPGFSVRVEFENSDFLEIAKSLLTTEIVKKFRLPNGNLSSNKKQVPLYKEIKGSNALVVRAGLLDLIAIKFLNDLEFTSVGSILPTEKWIDIFRNHPKNFGSYQLQDFLKLTKFRSGIAELFTGYGKTELMLALSESFDSKILILAPEKAVLEEIRLRAEKYGVKDFGIEDWGKRIVALSPTSFSVSSRSKSSLSKDWLASNKIILVDECHHVQAKSFLKVIDSGAVERIYGFSATADVVNGSELTQESDLKSIGYLASSVMAILGPARVRRLLPNLIKIKKIRIDSNSEFCNGRDSWDAWIKAFESTAHSNEFKSAITKAIKLLKDRKFFIPIPKKEVGKALYDYLVKEGLSGAFWTASDFEYPALSNNSSEPLECLKANLSKPDFRFLISTRFEGIDLPELNAIIPLVGTHHRLITQTLGRSARRGDLLVILIYDSSNPLICSQSRKRRDRMRKFFEVVEDEELVIW